mgnify:CR=1 FL=1|tara:strand:+ start:426 stop:1346 length:921 start_codon:yes stop_codon:yes gene_type:complete
MNFNTILSRFKKSDVNSDALVNSDENSDSQEKMSLAKKIKIAVIVIVILNAGATLLGYNAFVYINTLFESESEDESQQSLRLASTLAKANNVQPENKATQSPGIGDIGSLSSTEPSSSPAAANGFNSRTKTQEPSIQHTAKSDASAETSLGNGEFVVAPDYRTLNAMMALYANAANPTAEKDWMELKLSLKSAREYKKLVTERLEAAKARKALLDLEAQIAALDTPEQKPQYSQASATEALPQLELVGLFDRGNNIFSVDMFVEGEFYRGQFVGSSFGGYTLKSINEKNRCVTLISKTDVAQVICL